MEQTVEQKIYKDSKMKSVWKIIAKNMHASLQEMVQLTLNTSFDARKLLAVRKTCKESEDEDMQKITLNDMVLYAVANAS